VLIGLATSFALALTAAPTPAQAATSESAILQRILVAAQDGQTFDYAKAVKAAGKGNKRYAHEVAQGALMAGGTVTHAPASLKRTTASLGKSSLNIEGSASDGGEPNKPFSLEGKPDRQPESCQGRNALTKHVFGYVLSLDTCNVAKFQERGKTVGIVVGFLGIVLNQDPRLKIVVGASLALMAVGFLGLDRCNRKGEGIKVYRGWGAAAQVWCKSQ
jgi:hypothetical protein